MNRFILWVKTGGSVSPPLLGCFWQPPLSWAWFGVVSTVINALFTNMFYRSTYAVLSNDHCQLCLCCPGPVSCPFRFVFMYVYLCKYYLASSCILHVIWTCLAIMPDCILSSWSVVFVLPRPVTCPFSFAQPDPSPPWVLKIHSKI